MWSRRSCPSLGEREEELEDAVPRGWQCPAELRIHAKTTKTYNSGNKRNILVHYYRSSSTYIVKQPPRVFRQLHLWLP